jgi:hypothetical protein
MACFCSRSKWCDPSQHFRSFAPRDARDLKRVISALWFQLRAQPSCSQGCDIAIATGMKRCQARREVSPVRARGAQRALRAKCWVNERKRTFPCCRRPSRSEAERIQGKCAWEDRGIAGLRADNICAKERLGMKARLHHSPVMFVSRKILKHQKVVYLLISKRPIKYKNGRSSIAYIGTTSKGIHRVATSVAYRAADTLSGRGFSSLEVYFVTCPAKRNVRTWMLLEHALLAQFRAHFFEKPMCNTQGKHARWKPLFDRHFTKSGIDRILTEFDY